MITQKTKIMITKFLKKTTKLIMMAGLIFSVNLNIFAQSEMAFETITDALTYIGDVNVVTKLIIMGEISGDNYSDSSEWSLFKDLNLTFPNIESVEIFTNQDIPDWEPELGRGFFTEICGNGLYPTGSKWIKHFTAQNVKYIGSDAFRECEALATVSLPSVQVLNHCVFYDCKLLSTAFTPNITTIGYHAFRNCYNLSSVDFPLLTTAEDDSTYYITNGYFVRNMAFANCYGLNSVSFGKKFTEPTVIKFGHGVFANVETESVDLILYSNVLPLPNITSQVKTWQDDKGDGTGKPYVWKSITVYVGIEEITDIIKNITVNVFPNPTIDFVKINFELEKSCNVKIILCDILDKEITELHNDFTNEGLFNKTFTVENLSKGVYFLKILIDGKYITEKIVVN